VLRTRRIVSVALVLVVFSGSATAAASSRSAASGNPRAFSTSNTKYVASAVYDVLGRKATAADNARWVGPLDAGGTRSEFASQLVKTPERAAIVTNALYNAVLLRSPDAAGLAYWTAKLASGYRSANLAAALYASDEFYDGAGGTVDSYVKVVYVSVLERPADDAGLAYWTKRINAGTPRSSIARTFYLSRESNARRARTIYLHLLLRPPTSADLKTWSQALITQDDGVLIARLVASDEYYVWSQKRPSVGSTTTVVVPPKPTSTSTSTTSTTLRHV